MPANLDQWALKWAVPPQAIDELRASWGVMPLVIEPTVHHANPGPGKSENFAQSEVRLEASQKGMHLWRNNVGAFLDPRGVPVRFGLANTSAHLNREIKSADLIGIRKIKITPQWLGCTIGQFVSREIKHPGWTYRGDDHEKAQLRWANLINSFGGDAAFATGKGTL